MVFHWHAEDAEYIGSRSQRYPGALDIEPEWTQEVLSDPNLVEVTPYRRSRIGASAFIGRSPGAQRILLVLAYRDLATSMA